MFTFDVSPDGADTYRATATSRDVSHWERTGKGRSLSVLSDNVRMSALEEVAYLACYRLGKFTGTASEFRETCDITPIDLAKEAAEKAAAEKAAADGDDDDGFDDETRPTPPAP